MTESILEMTADTIGQDLLTGLIQEIRLLPDAWQKLSAHKQRDVIDRLRIQVINNVKMAVRLIASDDKPTVTGELEQVTVKDKTKAVFIIRPSSLHFHDLLDSVGQDVLLVMSNAEQHLGDIDAVQPDPDQNPLDLNGGDADLSEDGAWEHEPAALEDLSDDE